MKKEVITPIEKIKCPHCEEEIDIYAKGKIPQNKFELMVAYWFNVEAIYTGPDSVKFIKPDPPEPERYHWFKCVDASDTPMPPKSQYDGQFPEGSGGESLEIVEPKIRALTEANVLNKIWFWKAKKKPTI